MFDSKQTQVMIVRMGRRSAHSPRQRVERSQILQNEFTSPRPNALSFNTILSPLYLDTRGNSEQSFTHMRERSRYDVGSSNGFVGELRKSEMCPCCPEGRPQQLLVDISSTTRPRQSKTSMLWIHILLEENGLFYLT